MREAVHVTPNRLLGGWNVRRGGARRVSAHTQTREEAVRLGRVISQRCGGELVIHGKDGRIRRADSRAADSLPAGNAR